MDRIFGPLPTPTRLEIDCKCGATVKTDKPRSAGASVTAVCRKCGAIVEMPAAK